ncbi:hypothetical protein RQP46_005278 [Phenoliferia psychrophenolica]
MGVLSYERKQGKTYSKMDFSDGPLNQQAQAPLSFQVPLTPPAGVLAEQMAAPRRNISEKGRLQELMRPSSILSVGSADYASAPLGPLSSRARFRAWMVNEGSRRIFVGVWVFLHALVFAFGYLNYSRKDNLTKLRALFGVGYPIARSAALVLHFDVAFIMLPVCRNFISVLRRGPLNGVIPFEKNITFHKAVAWSIVFFSFVHVGAHVVNVYWLVCSLTAKTSDRIKAYILTNFTTGPGLTGWIMNVCLAVMVWYAQDGKKKTNFERFWYSHHLFIVINWQLHGMFCMLKVRSTVIPLAGLQKADSLGKPDREPFCSWTTIGSFWKWWIFGGAIYIYERILREVRARHRTYISKVILHPSKVVEVQIKKEKTVTRAGQYIFLNCPEVSYWQWHPFTLTSSPAEEYISVHIRVAGDFTTAFAQALGCDISKKEKDVGAQVVPPPLNKTLPRVMIDGPFGSASEDVFKFEVSVLVGAGIGVTPFASILKTIWYRLNFPPQGSRSRLAKVYFFWICRDYDSFEWFQSLLLAIEEQDMGNRIEIHTYLTAKIKEDDINNIFVQDVGGDRDTITSLRAPTHFGRPQWGKIFSSIAAKHPSTEVGTFFCGPKALGSQLHEECNKNTDGRKEGTKFVWGKENF